jgi:hypothetical protein
MRSSFNPTFQHSPVGPLACGGGDHEVNLLVIA